MLRLARAALQRLLPHGRKVFTDFSALGGALGAGKRRYRTSGFPGRADGGTCPLTKSILSVVPARVSPDAERIKASWRGLPIEFVELSRSGIYKRTRSAKRRRQTK